MRRLLLPALLALAILAVNGVPAAANVAAHSEVVGEIWDGSVPPDLQEVFRTEVVLAPASPACAEAVAADDPLLIQTECLEDQQAPQGPPDAAAPPPGLGTKCLAVGTAFIDTGIVFDLKTLHLAVTFVCDPTSPFGPPALLGCSATNLGTAVPAFAAGYTVNNVFDMSDGCVVFTDPGQQFLGAASFVSGGSLVGLVDGALYLGTYGPVGYTVK